VNLVPLNKIEKLAQGEIFLFFVKKLAEKIIIKSFNLNKKIIN